MTRRRRDAATVRSCRQWMRAVLLLLLVVSTARCTDAGSTTSHAADVSLRIGVPDVGASEALNGTRQLVQSFAIEGLARIAADGRPTPVMAENWTIAADRM